MCIIQDFCIERQGHIFAGFPPCKTWLRNPSTRRRPLIRPGCAGPPSPARGEGRARLFASRRFPTTWPLRYEAAMLSVILVAFDPPNLVTTPALRRERIVRSLSSLVPACVQGLIADAVVAGPPGVGLDAIADEAGCHLVEAADPRQGVAQALAMARHNDVFLLSAGYAIEHGFLDEVRDALAFGGAEPGMTLRLVPDSLLTRLSPNWAAPVGVIARKEALALAGAADVTTLAKKLALRGTRDPRA